MFVFLIVFPGKRHAFKEGGESTKKIVENLQFFFLNKCVDYSPF